MSTNLKKLHSAGVSIWLDDLSRELLSSGDLAELLATRSVVGVTTNPTIFSQALSNGESYEPQVRSLVAGKTAADLDDEFVEQAVFAITTDDVRAAADVLAPVAASTDGKDGQVSIEVDPRMARDLEGTVAMAKRLHQEIGRDNVMIKIPATQEGLPAITRVIAEGISVNVTLVFSLERYRHVVEAYLSGLERAREAGHDLSRIRSVASIFVSRVDSEIDKRLGAIGTPAALALKGRSGLANCRLAYQIYEQLFAGSARWEVLEQAGAHPQRPLWASTGTKDPDYPDTMYVTGLVAPNTVNTMPAKTMEAFADHGEITGEQFDYAEADEVLDSISAAGVDYNEVMAVLEGEGLQKFNDSWTELLATVKTQLTEALNGDQK